MKSVLKLLVALSLVIPSIALAQEPAPNAEAQFAWRAEIARGETDLRRVELMPEQLLGATRGDLGDVIVLDANGIPAPMLVRKTPVKTETMKVDLNFESFSSIAKNRARTVTETEQVTTETGTSTRKTTETLTVPQSRTDYLVELDTEQLKLGMDRLLLTWGDVKTNRMLRVSIESVSKFDEFGSGRVKVHNIAQHKAIQNWKSIAELAPGMPLHRISVGNSPDDFYLQSITGLYQKSDTQTVMWSEAQSLQPDSNEDNSYVFDLPAAGAGQYFRLLPAVENTILRGDVYASNKGWQRKDRVFADIQQHNLKTSEQIKASKNLALSRHYYEDWWFVSDNSLASPPSAQIGFEPQEVVFFANGAEPYTLVWGNKDSLAARNTLADLLTDAKQINNAETLTLGDSQIAGGEQRLTSRENKWLSWLLWLVLGLGVALTAKMAISLLREMNSSDKNKGKDRDENKDKD